jgi:integron integrase
MWAPVNWSWRTEVENFLTDLAVTGQVSASTQNQALNALAFLFQQVLRRTDLGDFGKFVRAKRSRFVPIVLSRGEVKNLLGVMEGTYGLMARLLYRTGMRLMECVRLRVKDVDFARSEITIRQGKGAKDRRTMLPASLAEALYLHVTRLKELHADDRARGLADVALPFAFERKSPRAGLELGWQWFFPAREPSVDPLSAITRRHHLHEDGLQRAVRVAVANAGIGKRVTCHTLRHSSKVDMTFARCRSFWVTRT